MVYPLTRPCHEYTDAEYRAFDEMRHNITVAAARYNQSMHSTQAFKTTIRQIAIASDVPPELVSLFQCFHTKAFNDVFKLPMWFRMILPPYVHIGRNFSVSLYFPKYITDVLKDELELLLRRGATVLADLKREYSVYAAFLNTLHAKYMEIAEYAQSIGLLLDPITNIVSKRNICTST